MSDDFDFFDRHPNWKSYGSVNCDRKDGIHVYVTVRLSEFEYGEEGYIDDEFRPICWAAHVTIPDAQKYDVPFTGEIYLPDEIRTMDEAVIWVDENYPINDVQALRIKLYNKYQQELEKIEAEKTASEYNFEHRAKTVRIKIARLLAEDPSVGVENG
jgi:hypothetical protein